MRELSNGQQLFGRFTLLEKMGAGGAAETWRARDERTQRELALKILFPQAAGLPGAWERLERECSIARSLADRYVLQIFPPVRDADTLALPMEVARGGDLRRLRGAAYARLVPLLIEIAEALEHAHARGVVHRDLKPGNVLLDAAGHIKLADFGIAALDGAVPPRRAGSPFSASPQQLAGEPARPADDIYGLGALAYELLSGYPPFYPHVDAARAAPVAVPDLKPTHPCPPRLHVLVMRMLAREPDNRPVSMREVAEELRQSLDDTLGEQSAAADPVPAARERAPPSLGLESESIVARPMPPLSGVVARGGADLRSDLPPMRATGPRLRAPESLRARRWPYALLIVLLLAAAAAFIALPRLAPRLGTVPAAQPQAGSAPARTAVTMVDAAARAAQGFERLKDLRANFEQRLAALEARAASRWGGPELAAARTSGDEALAAFESGHPEIAEARWNAADRDLTQVAARAPSALSEQLEAGDRALEAGQASLATQAFATALQIEPGEPRAAAGLKRAAALDALLPWLAEAANAEASGEGTRAAQLYGQVLARDPENRAAQQGLARSRTAVSDDRYARALGEGFQALAAGNLAAARAAFEAARQLQPHSREALDGLAQATAVAAGREFGDLRARAERAEAQERWGDALREYEQALAADPSLQLARAGRDRVAPRAELAARLQALIEHPDRLIAEEVRADAQRLMLRARATVPAGPVLRSQIARLELLLPDYDKPVRVALESDNATQVTIRRIGALGSFSRREIELKPGRYTVIGTREGFRDVRRDITISPRQSPPVLNIACQEKV